MNRIFEPHLTSVGADGRSAHTGQAGLRLASHILRELRTHSRDTVCVLIAKPITTDALLDVLKRARIDSTNADPPRLQVPYTEAHSLKRWADVVVRAISSPSDPRTLQEWGRSVGVSTGSLRNWCRTARLPSRRSLLFARLLRAILRQQDTSLAPEDLLNIVDRRTLAKLLALGGGSRTRLASSVHEFLQQQLLIDNQRAVAEVRIALAAKSAAQ